MTRADRKALQSRPEALKKLRDRVCVALEHKLKEPKWSEILAGDESGDMSATISSIQTAIDGVITFARQNDIFYIGEVPMVDLTDEVALAQCNHFVNVLTSYSYFSVDQVRDFQHFLNTRGFNVDIESNNWLEQVIEKSTKKTLLFQVKQTMTAFHPSHRGGIILFKLIVDCIANPSYEFIKVGIQWIEEFKLSKFSGENVPVANSRFKAVLNALPDASHPPMTVSSYLEGMAHCETEDFRDLVKSLRASIHNPLIMQPTLNIHEQVALFGKTLEDRYNAIQCFVYNWQVGWS